MHQLIVMLAAVRAFTANREIILSAGTFGTATLLQLSGIGDRADLQAAGVATIVHNPSVGKNLSDHALISNAWTVNNPNSYDAIFRSPDLINANLGQWISNKTGPFAGGVANNIGWLRLPSNASIFKTTPDPAAGPKSSHYEVIFSVRPPLLVFSILMLTSRRRTYGSTLSHLLPPPEIS